MHAIHAMWLREVKRYLRSRVQIIASLAQPMMYLLILGFGLSPVFQQAGQGNYIQFVAPGVVGMSVLFSSVLSGVGLLFESTLALQLLLLFLLLVRRESFGHGRRLAAHSALLHVVR